MRLLAALLMLPALAAAAMAGQALWHEISTPPDDQAGTFHAAIIPPPAIAVDAPEPRSWPALFGTPRPPAPPAPDPAPVAAVAPQLKAIPMPPLDSLGYQLRGLVRNGEAVWAFVAHPTGEQLVRRGETLAEGIRITRIDEAGLWLSRQSNPEELLAFPD